MPFQEFIAVFLITILGASYGVAFGGGSFVILPMLFFLGIDPKIAVASNVVAALAQIATGAFMFSRKNKIHFEVVKKSVIFYFFGGILGAFALINIPSDLLKKVIAIAIIIFAILSLFKRKKLEKTKCTLAKAKSILVYPFLLFLGAYQVMTTAGAGTMLTFVFVYLFDLRLKCAIYARQFVTLPTMSIAAIILAMNGMVDWMIFFPLILGRIVGAVIGSKLLMRAKSKRLSIIFSIIVILMAIKILFI